MSERDMSSFLKALDAVKEDYTCPVCLELCNKPVTLSKCFHLICAEHFEGLKTCPKCNVSLDGCTVYVDEKSNIENSINSAKQLDSMFEKYRKDEPATQTKKITKQKKEEQTEEKSVLKSKNTSMKEQVKPETKSRLDNLNTSIVSTLSSKHKSEKRNNKGETMLHIACRLGKIDKITELLNQGANTNTKDNAGWTPLHEVVQNGRLDLVTLLLQHNTLVNVPAQGNETPLHEAVRYNHKDIAEELVKNGADITARNSKGETPLQLASEEMKEVLQNAAENIIQTQGVNVSHVSAMHIESDFDDIRIYNVSQYRTVQNKLKLLTKHHDNVHIEMRFTKKVTHLIIDADDDCICTSSLDVLQGIVYGIWILSSQWVTKSSEENLEPFEAYEVRGVGNTAYQGPKNARFNKYKQLPGIFDGCHFYLHNFNLKYEISKQIIVNKAVLSKLISDAGGVVLRRVPNPESIPESEKLIPYHAKKDGKLMECSHYIIFKDMYEPMYNMKHLKALPIGWLIECLEKYELCEPW